MFARFGENPVMTLQDIKETKRYGQTDGRTDGQTHGQRENSIPTTKKVLFVTPPRSLYRYISYSAFTCNDHIYRYLPVSMKNGIVPLSCIFEQTVK